MESSCRRRQERSVVVRGTRKRCGSTIAWSPSASGERESCAILELGIDACPCIGRREGVPPNCVDLRFARTGDGSTTKPASSGSGRYARRECFWGVVDGRTCVFASAWHAHRGGGGGRLGKAVALCVALSRIQLRSQLEVQRANAQRGPTSALRRLRVLFASVAVLRTGQQTRAGRGPIEAVWSWARARGIVGSGAFRRVLSVSLSRALCRWCT